MDTKPQPTVWVDGDPFMEAIAAAVWEHCSTQGTSLVVDDPRNIAATVVEVVRSGQFAATNLADGAEDTLPQWLYQRFYKYQPGPVRWELLSDDERAYWAHEADAVRRAVVRGGFKAADAATADTSPKGWKARAQRAETTITRMKSTNRMVNGCARDSRERAEKLTDDVRFLLEWLDGPDVMHSGCWDAEGHACGRCTRVAQIRERLEA